MNPAVELVSRVTPRPSLWSIFRTMLVLGAQSFGGGSSTFYLIHQACIQRGWMEEEEFVRTWALSQITPGINLLKLTILIGNKLRGWAGILAALGGLVLPTAGLTALMTAGFSAVRSQPLVEAALKGVLPAAVGLSLAMGYQMAQPLLTRGYKEGLPRLSASLLVILAAALMLALTRISPVVVLLLCGALTVLLMAWVPVRNRGKPEERGE